jgi:(2Fe-2S) ferredoxin
MGNRNLQQVKQHILICNGESCLRNHGDEVTLAIRNQISELDADEYIHTTRTRCNGRCNEACVVIVYPEGNWYRNMTPSDGKQLVSDLLNDTKLVKDKSFHSFK